MRGDDPILPGWLWNGERLVVDDTVSGYVARRARLVASCRNMECKRQLSADLQGLKNMGYCRAPIQEVRESYRCGRRPQCDVLWTETYPEGLPLQMYVADQNAALEVVCDACLKRKRYTAPQLIAKLVAGALGDGNTGVNIVANRIRGTCTCGARNWRVGVVRPDPMEERRKASGLGSSQSPGLG